MEVKGIPLIEPGDMTDIERFRLVVSPAERSVEIYAQSHRGSISGPRSYENAVCAIGEAHTGARTSPFMTINEDAAWDMFKEMCRVYAGDYSVLEFNEIGKTMEVKKPGGGGGRFIPAGERTPLEAQLLEKVDLLERLLTAKDDNLADLRAMLPTAVECSGDLKPLEIEQLLRGPGEPLTPAKKGERY